MILRHSALTFHARRALVGAIAIVVACASLLVAAPTAHAAGSRTISGTFTVPASGIESWWDEAISIYAQQEGGSGYATATVNSAAKTFTFTGLEAGEWNVNFSSSSMDRNDDGYYEQSNLAASETPVHVDVTAGDVTGLSYAYSAGRTVSGTISLGSGASAAWKNSLEATVSIPGPEGCECGDSFSAKADPVTGAYVIRGLPAKPLRVSFGPKYGSEINLIPEYYNGAYVWQDATPVDFSTGSKTGINATLEVGKTISGTVALPGGVDASELANVRVSAEGANSVRADGTVNPSTGAYTIYGLAPSTYKVRFAAQDHWNNDYTEMIYTPLADIYYGGGYTKAAATPIDVTTANATGTNITMVVGRTISGTVSLGPGIDSGWMSALSVYAESDENFGSAKVNPATGEYTIKGLAPDTYTIHFDGTYRYVDGDYIYDDFADEYYNNQRNPYAAEPVSVTVANVSGINAVMDLQVGNRDFWVTPTPTVTGTAAPGQTLTAVKGTWEPYAQTIAYQWLRDGTTISGATASTFAVSQADAGHEISVSVTGSTPGFTSVTKTSLASVVPLTAFTQAPAPTITGTPATGETLTAVTGAWSPAATFTYQWLRNGAPIDGATASQYTVVAADAGQGLAVTVTASALGYADTPRTSAAVTPGAAFWQVGTPTIDGASRVGAFLTATIGLWSPAPGFSFQWLRNGVPIPGETETMYQTVGADLGAEVSVRVTATLSGYATTSVVSNAITPVMQNYLWVGKPTFDTTFEVGDTVWASEGLWDPTPDSISYQWLRNGVPISGATSENYIATASDNGKSLSLRVTGHRVGYNDATVESATTVVAPGQFFDRPVPTISGSTYLGATLTANTGAWTPTPTSYAYQWYRSGAAISGATAKTYKITASDASKKMSVKVTASRSGFVSVAKTSGSVTLVKFFTKYPTPTISGTVKVGYTVSVSNGTWSPTPTSYSYQWYRDGVAISGATKSTYAVSTSDAGKKLTVKVTAKRSGYASQPKTSSYKTVAYGSFKTAPTPKISGTVKVGYTLTASRGTWSPAASSYSYQWYRSGSAIPGATSYKYKLTSSDKGKTMTVKVTAKKTGYATTAKVSAKTATVK